ncbi:MAG: hypothetical protein WC542_00095 [Paludibacter sp.]
MGDSISAAEKSCKRFNDFLNSVFGDYSQNLDYTSTGTLTYDGSNKGISANQKATLDDPNKIMIESTITNVVYGERTQNCR